jgi:hypothetical protein
LARGSYAFPQIPPASSWLASLTLDMPLACSEKWLHSGFSPGSMYMGNPEGILALRGIDPAAESTFLIGCPGLSGFAFALLRPDLGIGSGAMNCPVEPAAGPRNACLLKPHSMVQRTYHLSSAAPQSSAGAGRAGLQIQIGPLLSYRGRHLHVSQPQSTGPLPDNSPRRRILHVPAS